MLLVALVQTDLLVHRSCLGIYLGPVVCRLSDSKINNSCKSTYNEINYDKVIELAQKIFMADSQNTTPPGIICLSRSIVYLDISALYPPR